MKFWSKISIVLLTCVAFVTPASAQFWTMPGKGTPVPCSTCVEPAKGKLTYPFNAPLVRHVGRYLDSSSTGNYQNAGMRTLRARSVRVYPDQNRIVIWTGETVSIFQLDTFFTSTLAKSLVPANKAFLIRPSNGWDRLGNPYEKVLPPDQYFYSEAKDSEWYVTHPDSQRMLNDFDLDDRGYLYVATDQFGWGLARDEGRTDASHVAYVTQVRAPFEENALFSIKSGSKYYAVLSDESSELLIYDVTSPQIIRPPVASDPRWIPPTALRRTSKSDAFMAWARDDATQRVAVVNIDAKVRVYDYSAYVAGRPPVYTYDIPSGKKVLDLAFDESGVLWLPQTTSGLGSNVLVRLAPTGNTYTPRSFDVYGGSFSPEVIDASSGYVSLLGLTADGYDSVLLKVQNGEPQQIDVDNFYRKYYSRAPANYTALDFQSPSSHKIGDAEIVEYGNKTYLMFSAGGLGDVFELEAGDSISISQVQGGFGTANPNAQSTEDGPFYGDIVKFKASTNTTNDYTINWDFGNPASGTANAASSGLNQEVSHQFTGYDTVAEVAAAKTVSAVVATDASISDERNVTLKVPKARIGVPGRSVALTQENRTDFDLVLGDQFTDASDGVVEGHFAEWVIDGVTTRKLPDETMDVGILGQHNLAFVANYGKYNATTFAAAQPFRSTINNITYNVKPFVATILPPVSSGTGYVFNATARVTTIPAALTATQWTVTWTLSSASSADNVSTEAIETQAETVAVGTIPSFTVPKLPSPDGKILKLQITVDAASVPTATFATYTTQMKLSIPNIAVTKNGCLNAGEPCTLTASSASAGGSTAGWQLAWVVKRGSTTVKTGDSTSVTFTPSEAGSYVATVRETAYDVAVDFPFSVAAQTCGPVPAQDALTITTDCGNSCVAGTPIRFEASVFPVYFQACDTYTWDFGDNTTGTGRSPTHTYTSNRAYTVKLTIKNNNSTAGTGTYQRTITLGGSSNPPDTSCVAPVGINITYTGNKGCGPGVACKTDEQITFVGRRVASNLLSCDVATWTFDGSQTSSAKSPKFTFTTPGTHTVSLVVSNTFGTSFPAEATVTVVQGDSGSSCNGTVPEGVLGMQFEGANSNCGNGMTTPCQLNETITFTASAIGYAFQTCDRFEWNFGDGSPVKTTRQATHTYTTARNSARVTLKVYNSSAPQGVTVSGDVLFTTVNEEPAPVLGYAGFPASGSKGVPVTFTVNSNINATGWSWDFGDGTVDNSQAGVIGKTTSRAHTFANAGTYNVRVTARRSSTSTNTGFAIGTITISDTPEYRYLLPVVTHIGGQGGSVWRTDVQIYNPDPNVSATKPLVMTATLRDITKTLHIADSTYIYEDFMKAFSSGDDSGPVMITTNSEFAPQIWTRTYNQTEAGTFGQFIPAIRLDAAGGGSAAGTGNYYLAGLRANVRFRTNLGLVNPNAQALPVTVTVYDDLKIKKAQFTRTVQPYQLLQFNLAAADAAPDLDPDHPFSVQLAIPDGQWLIAYASYIDGGSNDPVYMQAVRESDLSSPDFSSGVLPGVGHVGAWRSDVTIFNPNADTLVVDLAYYDGSGVKTGQASAVPIRAGEFLQYDDILKQGVFGNLADSLGMLRVTVTSYDEDTLFPMMFARTYNDGGAGKTYGQGIPGFAAARANVKPGKPALIPGVRKNAKYYTNIGLTNVTNGEVTVSVKILDPGTGAVIRETSFPLKALESIVAPNISLEGRENASIRIEVTGGDVWAFASVIDAGTSDPEYVPATPLQ